MLSLIFFSSAVIYIESMTVSFGMAFLHVTRVGSMSLKSTSFSLCEWELLVIKSSMKTALHLVGNVTLTEFCPSSSSLRTYRPPWVELRGGEAVRSNDLVRPKSTRSPRRSSQYF
jgi:hypothetical protein